ncbi:SNF2-related protein [Boudabousia tangfeifanii]|uniref:SNF2-related protein n=1 Tax=Boudabousia tangfeifanii TaxID=1912795 RepID=UPI001F3CF21D|nr:SNF2-related protein [Boudabousia tangfeifanii]
MEINNYQAKFYAHQLARSYASDHVGKLAGLLFDAQVEPKPHQIDAALFALKASTSTGVILADEVGLGKTIEAGIVICQYWAERKRRILIIAPSSLRQQWKQELDEKFAIPAVLLDSTNKDEVLGACHVMSARVLICSYEFVLRNEPVLRREWDLVVADEAHKLRSYWNGKAKIPQAVANVIERADKTVMLTATPLQNRLEELYGLVSVFDPTLFHSLEGFKERYIDSEDTYGLEDLTDRMSRIAKRTLRRDADKYVRFTRRTPMTFEFMPSKAEQELYEKVNSYLQRPNLYAFAKSQRHLSALIIRKRLGSSTYAVASTLEKIADRLSAEIAAGKVRDGRGVLVDDGDLNSDEAEAARRGMLDIKLIEPELAEKMRAEVNELRGFAALARSITINQKALKLIEALDKGFARLEEIGAPRKAIIFTDSAKTQKYLARTLTDAGWGEGLVLFNGANDSPAATAIYKQWLKDNEGSDLITEIQTADRRKALVDEFRERGQIMIATEAAAEGINLQFCSMLINYDLPWNPQRVEQRIGRVHRFGQKHDVTVVNFSNQGNLAEERILELLTEKFQLFTSVFGASDEVLGQIEDGLGFEQKIGEILDQCATAEEIEAAFNELEEQFATEISKEMRQVKAKVFDHLDPDVRDKLKSYDEEAGEVLNLFERLLLLLTQYELHGYADFSTDGRIFNLLKSPAPEILTGKYCFKSLPTQGSRQYRFNSPLGQWVLQQGLNTDTPPAHLTFSYSNSPRARASLKPLVGTSGTIRIDQVTFTARAGKTTIKESYLISAGSSDVGQVLDTEQIEHLMALQTTDIIEVPFVNDEDLLEALDEQATLIGNEVEERTAGFYIEQSNALDSRLQDATAAHDAAKKELAKKRLKILAKQQRATSAAERAKCLKELRNITRKVAEEDDRFTAERNRMMTENDNYLANLDAALSSSEQRKHLFTIRWSIEQ